MKNRVFTYISFLVMGIVITSLVGYLMFENYKTNGVLNIPVKYNNKCAMKKSLCDLGVKEWC